MSTGLALVYHRVGPKLGNPKRELLPALDLRSFRAHLDWLQSRFRLVRASELPTAISMRDADDPIPVAVTFDDDLASHADFVLPELAKRGIPATFFLSGTALDGGSRRAWWELLESAARQAPEEALGALTLRDRAAAIEAMPPPQQASEAIRLEALAGPDARRGLLDADGIGRLVEEGMEIGFHTLGHHRLPDLPEPEMDKALTDGRERLAKVVGWNLTSIAYPHGAVNSVVTAAARRAGYTTGFTTAGTVIDPASDPLDLARIYPLGSRIAPVRRLKATLRASSTDQPR
jgi:peptidoglycan/xylan/chitin deacetylase (PgdA/CDA1 family)